MDLWTIIKTVVRRWYVTLPLIVITAAIGYQVTSSAPPTYGSSATVLLVVPSGVPAGTAGVVSGATKQNPYLAFNGSLNITANAVAHVVADDAHRKAFADKGLSSDYTLTPATQLPGVIVNVSGTNAAKVSTTAESLVQQMEDELRSLQEKTGAPPDQRIVFTILDPPSKAVLLQPKVARVAAAIGAVGLAVTVGSALLVEGVAKSRRTKKIRTGMPPVGSWNPAGVGGLIGPLGLPRAAKPELSAVTPPPVKAPPPPIKIAPPPVEDDAAGSAIEPRGSSSRWHGRGSRS